MTALFPATSKAFARFKRSWHTLRAIKAMDRAFFALVASGNVQLALRINEMIQEVPITDDERAASILSKAQKHTTIDR